MAEGGGGGGGSAIGMFSDLLDIGEKLFGSEQSGTSISSGSSSSQATAEFSGRSTDRLDISDEAIDKIISDILAGPEGLASIFGGEQNSGIFDSSVAAQAAGDLTAKITGEIAKLRAERIQTEDRTQTQTKDTQQESRTDTKQKKKGLLNKIFGT